MPSQVVIVVIGVYKQIRNEVKNKIKKEYWTYTNSLFSLSDNKCSFWKFVKDQRNSKCPSVFKAANTQLHKPAAIFHAFNDYFTSVLTPARAPAETALVCNLPIPEFPPVTVNLDWLIKSLSNLNPHKAPAHDGISPRVLKAAAVSIADECFISNWSASHGLETFPTNSSFQVWESHRYYELSPCFVNFNSL